MPKSNLGRQTVDWRPEWEGEDLEEYEAILSGLRARISSFRELRIALGLSQAEAAVRLATSQSNVSKIEAKADPTVSTLRRLIGVDGELKLIAHLSDGKSFEIAIN